MFINNYCKAHNDRCQYIIKNYIKVVNGKKRILLKRQNCCNIWVDIDKIKEYYSNNYFSC